MSMTDDIADKLAAEFNRSDVHWRAQTVSKNGDKALALAYIDARDVMERLDSVMGPANWQDRYEVHGARVVCYLSLRFGEEWITKADGAGDTAVEAEKGGLSDAFKRAAVKWGIGRYLYDLDAPWVPCETYEAHGKKHWRRWTVDPWSCVKGKAGAPEPQQAPADSGHPSYASMKESLKQMQADLLDCMSIVTVEKAAKEWRAKVKAEHWPNDYKATAADYFKQARDRVRQQTEEAA